ncbi:hypothetical protein A1F94_002103 [Pyrenophora tritici-repentis]|uniref:Uncharacterized protein n=2 Tax=Pyrenophora tritici-repentis TaxID=45151 RepID=A0A2W1G0P1_9PLEO|nr:uncharacterized protein PTRG_02294 [Pyrenophora tritici-repentis Pt-1C-BFP]KAF7455468.1 hypothetical protein A1F99_027260 [Pyrenophora tritici-repentis]EDU41732.1 predicted protein [Pyrenophora tritici-repentis Pt-1C-BFP]KAG9389210.1 hypothetical protein A1F94_002103 [Pyrenophora tritici-repentis]KAI1517669.1 hypothetical protein Ptr86124_002970 [Pyrenophora tritici-repentis]KAI1673458.1 hypothetical protein L13192_00205 [Pyrenophora tritici-repentis]
MATQSTLSTSIPDIPPICDVQLPHTLTNFAGLLALGPTITERKIPRYCCHTWKPEVFSVNETAYLQKNMYDVHECSNRDPSFVCAALLREESKVSGAFGCLKGIKGSADVSMKVPGQE